MKQRSELGAAAHADTLAEPRPVDEDALFRVLDQLDVEQKPARIVAYLAAHGQGRSADIEDACDMRQPEVSQATMALRDRGWVVADREKTAGKGRPVNVYKLKVSLEDISREIEATKREQINQELARLERLKSVIGLDGT